MANEFQKELLSSYPGAEVLPTDPGDFDSVDRDVRDDATGDVLFNYLWIELGKEGNPGDACLLVTEALDDVRKVHDAMLAAGLKDDPKAVILRSYPRADAVPLDLDDRDEVEKAVKGCRAGDLLFTFLWREIGDTNDIRVSRMLLGHALDDLQAVADSLRMLAPLAR